MSRSNVASIVKPLLIGFTAGWLPHAAAAQARPVQALPKPTSHSAQMAAMADGAMDGGMDENMMKHMRLTPPRVATHADTVRALKIATELKQAIAKYQDTAAAVADGYKMFLPGVKNQHVYHFTNNGHALRAAFGFDATEPTSILYKREADGKLHLVGAMYTAPNSSSFDRLDARVPLSIAHWHEHVNWCLPKRGEASRYQETQDGKPVFGPESEVATKSACDAVGGTFYPRLFGWMVHVDVFEGRGPDLASVFGDRD